MNNIKEIIKNLESRGFKATHGQGSRMKLFPPNKTQKFYSLHIDNSGKAFFPLKRFAKANWGIDLEKL